MDPKSKVVPNDFMNFDWGEIGISITNEQRNIYAAPERLDDYDDLVRNTQNWTNSIVRVMIHHATIRPWFDATKVIDYLKGTPVLMHASSTPLYRDISAKLTEIKQLGEAAEWDENDVNQELLRKLIPKPDALETVRTFRSGQGFGTMSGKIGKLLRETGLGGITTAGKEDFIYQTKL